MEDFPVDDPFDHCSNSAFEQDVAEQSEAVVSPPYNHQQPPSSLTAPVPQFAFTGNKAGMEQVDKEHVNRIIEQASQGNPYYEKAKRDEEHTRERAREIKQKREQLTAKDLSVAQHMVNKRVTELEREAKLTQVYCMLDMDQFFVAVEMRDAPELVDKPVAVGKGLISTANYVARRYGVRSAMPEFIARKLCPQLICTELRMSAYVEASKLFKSVLAEYDPSFQSHSLDECLLDLTRHARLRGLDLQTKEGVEACNDLVEEIRRKVAHNTGGLTCSAGVACTAMLAKICSEKNKPNGQFVLHCASREAVTEFIRDLPVRKIPGIGKASEIMLQMGFGVHSVRDLWDSRYALNRLATPAMQEFYLRVALAVTGGGVFGSGSEEDEAAEEQQQHRKSISFERTFRATSEELELKERLMQVCLGLAQDLAEKSPPLFGRTLTLKIKTDEFEVRSRGESFKSMIGGKQVSGQALYNLMEPMLLAELPVCARLLGVRLSNLVVESSNNNSNNNNGTITLLDRFLGTQQEEEDEDVGESCPICATVFSAQTSNDQINAHIDACLNSSLVYELVSDTTTTGKRVKRIDEYFKS